MSAAPRVRFNLPLIALHWLTLLLIAGAYVTSELREAFEDTPTEAVIDEWHALLGLTVLGLANAGYFLIGLHAAAALFHHYVVRDNTLRLMVPGWRGTGR